MNEEKIITLIQEYKKIENPCWKKKAEFHEELNKKFRDKDEAIVFIICCASGIYNGLWNN